MLGTGDLMEAAVVSIEFDWCPQAQLTVEERDGGSVVRAHLGLSETQVRRACDELGSQGHAVYEAWCRAVGLSRPLAR